MEKFEERLPHPQCLKELARQKETASAFVADFLNANPDFLEDYTHKHLSIEDLERLLIRKSHRKTHHQLLELSDPAGLLKKRPDEAVDELCEDLNSRRCHTTRPSTEPSSPNHDQYCRFRNTKSEEKRLSLSRWKFCVHADKRIMLQQLTKDITNYHSKVQVLLELSDCISNAINADSANLYFLNDNKDMLYHCHPGVPSPDGLDAANLSAQHMTHFKVAEGTNVAAYVAIHRKTILLKHLDPEDEQPDSRFPDGVGIGRGREPTSALVLPIQYSDGNIIGVLELLKHKKRDQTIPESNPRRTSAECFFPFGRKFSTAKPGTDADSDASNANLASYFGEEDEEIASSYLVWGGIAVYYAEMYVGLRQQRNLNDFLLDVIKSLFKDINVDKVVSRIMGYAKQLVNADRAALFMIDHDDLYAQLFDHGQGPGETTGATQEIRFPKSKGIAGYVATTGETLNIVDAYRDHRFNSEVDLITGYKTSSVLCMPIYIKDRIIGVVELVNKKGGSFTKKDEQAFQMFAVYCGLGLHNAKLYDKLWKSEQRYKVAMEILSYHVTPKEDEISEVYQQKPVDLQTIQGFDQFEFFGWHLDAERKVRLVLDMFNDLFSGQWVETSEEGLFRTNETSSPLSSSTSSHASRKPHQALKGRASVDSIPEHSKSAYQQLHFDGEVLVRFFLTIRKNYREVPYHNWNHAFEVAHAMYCILKRNHKFSLLESLGLFIACVCHDVDHRGKTNSYMVRSASPLGEMFSTSTMEHHHFKHTITVLQQDGHNIFSQLCTEDYKEVLNVIRRCIIATDLVQFFKNKDEFKSMIENKSQPFSWEEEKCRNVTMSLAMTSCDLTSGFTTWEGSQELANHIMEEFWQQGDDETSKGLTTLDNIEPILDRRQGVNLPSLEVGFIGNVCLPCYRLLSVVILETEEMVKRAEENLVRWKNLVEVKQEQEGKTT